jgi:hypothetical protein
LKFYADVHRSKRNGEGYRITYTSDGTTFKHVDGFGEIPASPEISYSWIRCLSSILTAR